MSFGIAQNIRISGISRKTCRAHTAFAFDDVKNEKNVVVSKMTSTLPPPNFLPIGKTAKASSTSTSSSSSSPSTSNIFVFNTDSDLSFFNEPEEKVDNSLEFSSSSTSSSTSASSSSSSSSSLPAKPVLNQHKLLHMQDRVIAPSADHY